MGNSFIIGKYTLESLTNGMYANPFDLLREYVQNAVDSIDSYVEADSTHLESNRILIEIDTKQGYLKIEDNGTGIPVSSAYKTLLDIGNSQKDLKKSRGFRGIGRLSGLGYCDKLIFTTSFTGESEKSIVTFDSKKLKELLIPGCTVYLEKSENPNRKTLYDLVAVEKRYDQVSNWENYFFQLET